MNARKISRTLISCAAFFLAIIFSGCGEKPDPASTAKTPSMPDVNDENCRSDSIKLMPENAQETFYERCVRRSKPIQSEKKSYGF